ncbi:hypothetical protein KM043_017899 [Ampulex compressa]|nr:hypothetical protein KM043_017899 [Ampulex compressa]
MADNTQFLSELNNCVSWEQKLDTLLAHIPAEMSQNSLESYKEVICTINKRLCALLIYNTSQLTIKSPITFIKASEGFASSTSSDYGLKQLAQGELEMYVVPGNHVTIMNHDTVAAIINRVCSGEDDAR